MSRFAPGMRLFVYRINCNSAVYQVCFSRASKKFITAGATFAGGRLQVCPVDLVHEGWLLRRRAPAVREAVLVSELPGMRIDAEGPVQRG